MQKSNINSRFVLLAVALVACIVLCYTADQVSAGGKGGKGKGKGQEDIILYNGNIILRGDKKGGSIIMANQHPHHEEVEFAPSFFGNFGEMGHMGGHHRR